MPVDLEFSLAPERLSEGSAEEKAAFGLFKVRSHQGYLTEGFDAFINGYRNGPLVSGYHVAEWLAWNWWRLRWEPRTTAEDWYLAHKMSAIGEGYVWPNITIFSDGVRTALLSLASQPDAKAFRYVGAFPTVIPSALYEAVIDAFIPQIIARLNAEGVHQSNLQTLWSDVLVERQDPAVATRRKLEALLGRDPDCVEDGAVEKLIGESGQLGVSALVEIAADASQRGRDGVPLSAEAFNSMAEMQGFAGSPHDRIRLDAEHAVARSADIPAWRFGALAAQALRAQLKIGAAPISNARLAEMAGASERTLTDIGAGGAELSFALDRKPTDTRFVLRSKWEAGRRFDLARLLGDRLIETGEMLHPATRASTYRQKAQRSFAAELLSPFEVADEMMHGDYSAEMQQEVAEYFNVSERTIDTLLKNHRRIPRDDGEFDFDAVG